MTGYDPGLLTKTYSDISGTSKKVTKVYDGTTSISSATFGNATVTSANGLSSNLNVTLSDQTYTYSEKDAGNNKVVTAIPHTAFRQLAIADMVMCMAWQSAQ